MTLHADDISHKKHTHRWLLPNYEYSFGIFQPLMVCFILLQMALESPHAPMQSDSSATVQHSPVSLSWIWTIC